MLNSDFTFWAHFLGFKSQNGNNRLACDTIKMVLGKICAASALELTSRSTQLECYIDKYALTSPPLHCNFRKPLKL